eukprot:10108749-Prorocentrum_lima.AAC.1
MHCGQNWKFVVFPMKKLCFGDAARRSRKFPGPFPHTSHFHCGESGERGVSGEGVVLRWCGA